MRGAAFQPLWEFVERDYLRSCIQKQSLTVTCASLSKGAQAWGKIVVMCRNIKTLFNFDPPVTEEEVRAASLQFVRKISGFNKPSKANEKLFQDAVDEIAGVSTRLLIRSKPTRRQRIGKKRLLKRKLARRSDSEREFS
jgi:hypothetical protein